jgi:hypothetical protein
LQRNLIQLFNFLQRERGHPSPYTDALNRYAEVKGRPLLPQPGRRLRPLTPLRGNARFCKHKEAQEVV